MWLKISKIESDTIKLLLFTMLHLHMFCGFIIEVIFHFSEFHCHQVIYSGHVVLSVYLDCSEKAYTNILFIIQSDLRCMSADILASYGR